MNVSDRGKVLSKISLAVGELAQELVGRVVWVEPVLGKYWWTPFPETRPIKQGEDSGKSELPQKETAATKSFIKSPRVAEISAAEQQIESGELQLLEFMEPDEWCYSAADATEDRRGQRDLMRSRRNLQLSVALAAKRTELIGPILARFSFRSLIVDDLANIACKQRAEELGLTTERDIRRIRQALNLAILGCSSEIEKSLRSNYGNCGRKGKVRQLLKPTGRPEKHGRPNFLCTELDKKKLRAGYKRFMRDNVSLEKAYYLTMAYYYAKSVKVISATEKEVELLPLGLRPSITQFRRYGPSKNSQPSDIKLGPRALAKKLRGIVGTAKDGLFALGQVGVIDSTCEDQTPISSIFPDQVLPSSWRTMLVCPITDYIFGFHSGFEHGSVMTSLLAILSAASSKVALCAELGITITEEEWLTVVFKRVRGDHGDVKGELGFKTMSEAQISLEFTRSYTPHLKTVEATHHKGHAHADHLNAGTTKGKQRGRGDADPEADACLTFRMILKTLVEWILFHNNVQLVPWLVTTEMRQTDSDMVPTRQNIALWYRRNHYYTHESATLDYLRRQCLPRLKATIHADGVHIFDPRDERHLIDQFVFYSDSLYDSGLTRRAKQKGPIGCVVMLDPSHPKECFLDKGGFHTLCRRDLGDPAALELPLCEFLMMKDGDDFRNQKHKNEEESKNASRLVNAGLRNAVARKAKGLPATDDEAMTPDASPNGKNEARRAEMELEARKALGIDKVSPTPKNRPPDSDPIPQETDLRQIMLSRATSGGDQRMSRSTGID